MFRVSLMLAALALAGCVSSPPVQEMSDARQAINAAEAAMAGRPAPDSLRDAQRFLAEAEEQIQQQAYGPARFNAIRAKNRAALALRSSGPSGARD
jgi:prophage DNA circulation protein